MSHTNQDFGDQHIQLLFRLISSCVPLETENQSDVEICKKLISQKYAREVTLNSKPVAIATLDGVSVFRRHYNVLSLTDALEKHQRQST